jgi:outer membrane protein
VEKKLMYGTSPWGRCFKITQERKERSILMKKVFLLFVCVGLLLSTPLVSAAEVKIGYINVKRVFNDSKRGLKEKEAFTVKVNEVKKKIDKKRDEIQAMKESLEKKAAMLSEQARRDQEKEYQQQVREYEWLVKDSNEELKKMEQEMLDKLMKSLQKVVESIGAKENYTLILEENASSVLYALKEMDITDQVIKAFDAAKE